MLTLIHSQGLTFIEGRLYTVSKSQNCRFKEDNESTIWSSRIPGTLFIPEIPVQNPVQYIQSKPYTIIPNKYH